MKKTIQSHTHVMKLLKQSYPLGEGVHFWSGWWKSNWVHLLKFCTYVKFWETFILLSFLYYFVLILNYIFRDFLFCTVSKKQEGHLWLEKHRTNNQPTTYSKSSFSSAVLSSYCTSFHCFRCLHSGSTSTTDSWRPSPSTKLNGSLSPVTIFVIRI